MSWSASRVCTIDRQPARARQLDLGREHALLEGRRGVVVVVVEPHLAEARASGSDSSACSMAADRAQRVGAIGVGVHRVDADGEAHARPQLPQARRPPQLLDLAGVEDAERGRRSRRPRPQHDVDDVGLERLVGEVAVRVDRAERDRGVGRRPGGRAGLAHRILDPGRRRIGERHELRLVAVRRRRRAPCRSTRCPSSCAAPGWRRSRSTGRPSPRARRPRRGRRRSCASRCRRRRSASAACSTSARARRRAPWRRADRPSSGRRT